MKYFTAEEAERVIENACIGLCILGGENPNYEAMKALADQISQDGGCDKYWAACAGFVLGRATGIREERARRKEAAK